MRRSHDAQRRREDTNESARHENTRGTPCRLANRELSKVFEQMIVLPAHSVRAIRFTRAVASPFVAYDKRRVMGTSRSSCEASTRLGSGSATTSNALYRPESEVLLASSFGSQHIWKQRLEDRGLTVRLPGEDTSKVELGIVFNHPPGVLDDVENLKAVQSLGAGVDFMMQDESILRRNVPLLRIVDPLMADRMATFCVWATMNFQRKCDEYFRAQLECRWDKSVENYKNIDNHEMRVGVMGLGLMGAKVAKTLAGLGYEVYGWKRTDKQDWYDLEAAGVRIYRGEDEFLTFASKSLVVINLLPLTEETRGILNARLFNSMPKGGAVMNLARGAHLVANDLLDALASGQLEHAVLDVFVKEPLPETCPFWKHPKVRVFPHMSSVTDIPNGIEQILRNRELVLKGEPLPPGVQAVAERGY